MIATRSLQAASAAFEVGAGVALLTVPRTAVRLLLGAEPRAAGVTASRACGLALLCLGLACRPRPKKGGSYRQANARAVHVLARYNTLAAAALAQPMLFGRHRGIALAPAIAIHTVFAALFARARG